MPRSKGKKLERRRSSRLARYKDSSLVQGVERLPVVGYAASAGHGISSLVTGVERIHTSVNDDTIHKFHWEHSFINFEINT